MKHRRWNIAAWITMAITVGLLGLLMYWSLVPFSPLVVIPENKLYVANENKTVMAGEDLILTYRICRHSDLTATVTRFLEDNQVIVLPELQVKFPKGCTDLRVSVIIPVNAPSDTYVYKSQVTYQVSPIKTVSYSFESEPFKVTGKIL